MSLSILMKNVMNSYSSIQEKDILKHTNAKCDLCVF